MSVQVSIKKQFVFLLILLIILILVVELIVNIWLYNFYRCEFEDNEFFKNIDSEIKRKMCLETLTITDKNDRINFVERTTPENKNIVYNKINNQGFRGPDFFQEKSENTIRVFAVGGSTTFGGGKFENGTWPGMLQIKFEGFDSSAKIEVINVGHLGWDSRKETDLIKNRLVNFEPDLFIIYDGINDIRKLWKGNEKNSPILWKERWAEICELGKEKNFDTVIILQAMAGTGNRVLTQQEIESSQKKHIGEWLEEYPLFLEKLEELNNNCTKTSDYTKIFDDVEGTVFWDGTHVGPSGNIIVAENVYETILPIITLKTKNLAGSKDLPFQENTELSEPVVNSYDEVNYFFEDLISFYKTPKIFSLIFE